MFCVDIPLLLTEQTDTGLVHRPGGFNMTLGIMEHRARARPRAGRDQQCVPALLLPTQPHSAASHRGHTEGRIFPLLPLRECEGCSEGCK